MKKILILLIAASISLDVYYIYPLCFVLLFVFNRKKAMFNYESLLLLLLMIIFITSFLFKVDDLFLPNPILTITKYVVILVMLFYISFFMSIEEKLFFFKVFCLSMMINGLIIIYYSYFLSITTNAYFGYGRLFNPIHNVETVSPKIALSIVAPLTAYCLLIKNNRIVPIILISLSIYAFLFVQSRTSLIVSVFVAIALLFDIYRGLTTPKKTYVMIFLAFVVSINTAIYFIGNSERSFEPSENRLINSGFESKRFLHWMDGLNKFFEYPMGGFSVDQNIEHVNYFHNILIDSARIYGWAAALVLVFILFIQFYILLKYKIDNYYNLLIVLLLLNLIMMQDVVIEGNYLLLALSILISFLSSQNKVFGKS